LGNVNRLLSWLGKDTSIKSGGVKLVLWAQSSTLGEMMRPCTCFLHVNAMMTVTHNLACCVDVRRVWRYQRGKHNP